MTAEDDANRPVPQPRTVVGARPEDGEEFSKGGQHDISHGPVKKRQCTDVIFCILFLLHWLGVIIIASVAFATGDPNRLLAGRDYEGDFCGLDSASTIVASTLANENLTKSDFPRLYYTLNLTALPADFPVTDQSQWRTALDPKKFGTYFTPVCVKACPCFDDTFNESAEATCPAGTEKASTPREFDFKGQRMFALAEAFCPYAAENCLPLKTDPVGLFDRYCIPQLGNSSVSIRTYVPNDILDSWTAFVGDIRVVWPVLAATCGISLLLGMLYLVFIRMFAGLVVWIGLIATFLAFALGGWACWLYSEDVEGETNKKALWVLGIIVWSMGGLAALVTICLCRQIRTGIAIVKTAAMFIYNVPTVLLMPLIFFLVTISLYCIWILCALYIMSAVDETEIAGRERYSWNTSTQRIFAYHCFSLLWNNAFLIGLNQVIIAGTVGAWYFTMPDNDGRKNPQGSVGTAVKNAVFYHTGSVAFGSLILAIIQLIKSFLKYLAYQAQYAKTNPGTACAKCSPCGIGTLCASLPIANMVWTKLLLCLAYLVSCFERCIKFLNKNAYIQVALLGKNFCRSSYAAFCLILRNVFRISVLALVGRALRTLGLLCIVASSSVIGFFIMESWKGDKVSSPIFPVILFVMSSWLIAATIMDVLAMAIDTTLQCFVADEEMSGKGQGGEFTPEPLRNVLVEGEGGGCCCGGRKSPET